jgi:hypothetical protein
MYVKLEERPAKRRKSQRDKPFPLYKARSTPSCVAPATSGHGASRGDQQPPPLPATPLVPRIDTKIQEERLRAASAVVAKPPPTVPPPRNSPPQTASSALSTKAMLLASGDFQPSSHHFSVKSPLPKFDHIIRPDGTTVLQTHFAPMGEGLRTGKPLARTHCTAPRTSSTQ